MAGPVTVEVNVTTANRSFAESTVTRNFTVTSNRTVTVAVERDGSAPAAPDVTGDGNPARDPDGDGVYYEDVNGDGSVTPGDATVLFEEAF